MGILTRASARPACSLNDVDAWPPTCALWSASASSAASASWLDLTAAFAASTATTFRNASFACSASTTLLARRRVGVSCTNCKQTSSQLQYQYDRTRLLHMYLLMAL